MRNPWLAATLLLALSADVTWAAAPAVQSKVPLRTDPGTGKTTDSLTSVATVCVDGNGAFTYCSISSSGGSGSTASPVPTQSAPSGGNVTVTTSAATAIPAAARLRWSYQAQGTGHACASWVTASVTITVSAADVVTCGGAGAFALSPGSSASSQPNATPNTALTVIGAAPAGGTLALNLAWDAQ